MDKVYEAAVQRLNELEAEVRELNKFIHLYRVTRQKLGLESAGLAGTNEDRNILSTGDNQPVGADSGAAIALHKPARVVDNPKPAAVVEEAIRIIEDVGHPMSRGRLHKALAERGVVVNGVDPVKTLGTILWRGRERLEQVEGRGYWPKGKPVPPVQKPVKPSFVLRKPPPSSQGDMS